MGCLEAGWLRIRRSEDLRADPTTEWYQVSQRMLFSLDQRELQRIMIRAACAGIPESDTDV